jgi:hypothetical protein
MAGHGKFEVRVDESLINDINYKMSYHRTLLLVQSLFNAHLGPNGPGGLNNLVA